MRVSRGRGSILQEIRPGDYPPRSSFALPLDPTIPLSLRAASAIHLLLVLGSLSACTAVPTDAPFVLPDAVDAALAVEPQPLAHSSPVATETSPYDAAPGASAGTSAAPSRKIVGVVLPDNDFLPIYIASPNRAQTAFIPLAAVNSEIPETGTQRFAIRMGGTIGVVRFHPEGDKDTGFQIDVEIGFAGQFDGSQSLDNIGWNGIFGFRGAYKPVKEFALHFGTLHNSAHIGDEYAERTGRQRIEYTREEIVVGASFWPIERWRFYSDLGVGFGQEDFQEPLRVNLGAECSGDESWWFAGVPWYAAFDLDSFQERDWRPAVAGQVGIIVDAPEQGSRVRFAFEAFTGRSWRGEFSFSDETYIGFGVFYDL